MLAPGLVQRQVSCSSRDPNLCRGARQPHAAARAMGHQALPPHHPGAHSCHGHMWKGAPCSCIPQRNTRRWFDVCFMVTSATWSLGPHQRVNHPAFVLCAEPGLCQGCPVPDLGTAKAQWLRVSQSSSRLPSGLGHSLEHAPHCGQGLEQRHISSSHPGAAVFSLEFSMGFPQEVFMWGRCKVLVCSKELC